MVVPILVTVTVVLLPALTAAVELTVRVPLALARTEKSAENEVKDKTLPNGGAYDWTMRRDETHRSSRKKLV